MYLNTRIFSDYWLRTSVVIDVYKARARRNGYRMFISVYILCIYIGKILDGILPVGLHKFVTELWTLIDIFTTWNT